HEPFVADAEETIRRWGGPGRTVSFDRLAEDQENVRGALAVCLGDPPAPDLALRLAGTMGLYWSVTGRWNEGLEALTRVLEHPSASDPTAIRALALSRAAVLGRRLGRFADGRLFAEEALAISRAREDRAG